MRRSSRARSGTSRPMDVGSSNENVPWVEPVEVELVDRQTDGFAVTLADGERFVADRVVIATGLAGFAYVPPVIASLPPALATHTSRITSFAAFKGREVAVIGAGQSALEAAALLHEAGAQPQLLVRENSILWQNRVSLKRSLWRKLALAYFGVGYRTKSLGAYSFSGCDASSAREMANSLRQEPSAGRGRVVASRSSGKSVAHPFRSDGRRGARGSWPRGARAAPCKGRK